MTDRTTVTTALFDTWDALDALLTDLAPDRWQTPTALPGWTVHDVVSHIVGTESLLLGEPIPDVEVGEPAHIRNPMGSLNERWVLALRALSPAQLLTRFREVTGRRRAALSALDDAGWSAPTPSPIGETSYGRFMRIRVFDCWMHEHDIADAVGATCEEGGARGAVAIGEITGALGYIVGKLGGAPDGSRVTLALTGPLAGDRHVAVDGRARTVDALDGPATTTITMDSRLFTRLAGGRTGADDHAGEYSIDGDAEAGMRIVRNLAFTI